MEKSLPTKDKSKNDGETSRGPDQTIVPTDVESTSCDIVNLVNFVFSCLFYGSIFIILI